MIRLATKYFQYLFENINEKLLILASHYNKLVNCSENCSNIYISNIPNILVKFWLCMPWERSHDCIFISMFTPSKPTQTMTMRAHCISVIQSWVCTISAMLVLPTRYHLISLASTPAWTAWFIPFYQPTKLYGLNSFFSLQYLPTFSFYFSLFSLSLL